MFEPHAPKRDDRNKFFSFSKSPVFHGLIRVYNIKCIRWVLTSQVSIKFFGIFSKILTKHSKIVTSISKDKKDDVVYNETIDYFDFILVVL